MKIFQGRPPSPIEPHPDELAAKSSNSSSIVNQKTEDCSTVKHNNNNSNLILDIKEERVPPIHPVGTTLMVRIDLTSFNFSEIPALKKRLER